MTGVRQSKTKPRDLAQQRLSGVDARCAGASPPRSPETGQSGTAPPRFLDAVPRVASAAGLDDRGRHGVGDLHCDPLARLAGGREPAHGGVDHDCLSHAIRRLEGDDARRRVVGEELDHHIGGGAGRDPPGLLPSGARLVTTEVVAGPPASGSAMRAATLS